MLQCSGRGVSGFPLAFSLIITLEASGRFVASCHKMGTDEVFEGDSRRINLSLEIDSFHIL